MEKDEKIKLDMDPKVIDYLKSETKSKDEAIKLFGEDNVNDGFFICKGCGKKVPTSKLKIFNSNVVKGITAQLCDECWDYVKKEGAVFLVCIKCKELRKVMEPFKNPVSGFEFKKNNIYHIEDCPVCNPDKFIKNSSEPIPMVIIEEAIYNGKRASVQSNNKS